MMQAGKTMGLVTTDATLIFQILNTLILLLIVIGIPIIIVLIIRALKRKNKAVESMNDKLDQIIKKLD
jgi:hypothetical protein